MDTSVACEACAAATNMGLQMALCGAVGGVVLVKLAANDLLGKLHVRSADQDDEPDAGDELEAEATLTSR
jgi:hypothetical protein